MLKTNNMKWEIIDRTPQKGDIRMVTKFAWFPVIVLSQLTMTDHRIWLESYIEEQEYNKWTGSWDGLSYWKTMSKKIYK